MTRLNCKHETISGRLHQQFEVYLKLRAHKYLLCETANSRVDVTTSEQIGTVSYMQVGKNNSPLNYVFSVFFFFFVKLL